MNDQIKKDKLFKGWRDRWYNEWEVAMAHPEKDFYPILELAVHSLLETQAYETEKRVIKDTIKALKTKLELTEGSSCTCCAGDEDYFYDLRDVIKILKSLYNPQTDERTN